MKNDELNALHGDQEIGGIFSFELRRAGKIIDQWEQENLIPVIARDHWNNTVLNGGTAITNWYIALYSNAYTPQDDDLYTHIGTRFTELNAEYDEVTRPVWTPNGVSASGIMSNSASRATFTFNQAATINGGLFVSVNTKGDAVAGMLLAASLHTPARTVQTLDELLVKYDFTTTSS